MLPCQNCKTPVTSAEGKVIFEVFVCPTCFTIAEKIYKDSEQGIKRSLVILKDSIRQRLITGTLQLPEAQPGTPSHTEVMRMIVWLQEAYDVARNGPRAGDTALPRKQLPGKE